MIMRQHIFIIATLLTVSFLLFLNTGCGENDPQILIKDVTFNLSTGNNKKALKYLNKLNKIGYELTKEESFLLLSSFKNATLNLSSYENLLYIATPLSIEDYPGCVCSLYRLAIDSFLTENSVENILSDNSRYTQIMTLLGRSSSYCQDKRSLLIRSTLSIGKDVGYNLLTMQNFDNLSKDNQSVIFVLTGLSCWLKNDYESANHYFQKARACGYNEFFKDNELFTEHFMLLKSYRNNKIALKEAEKRLEELKIELAEKLDLRGDAVNDLISIDSVDIILFVVKNATKKKAIIKGANAIGSIITLIELINLYESTVDTMKLKDNIEISEKSAEHLGEKFKTVSNKVSKEDFTPEISEDSLQSIINKLVNDSKPLTDILIMECNQ